MTPSNLAKPLTADEIVSRLREYANPNTDHGFYPLSIEKHEAATLLAIIEQRDKELAAIKETAGKVLDAYMALSKSLDKVGNALRGEKPWPKLS